MITHSIGATTSNVTVCNNRIVGDARLPAALRQLDTMTKNAAELVDMVASFVGRMLGSELTEAPPVAMPRSPGTVNDLASKLDELESLLGQARAAAARLEQIG